jgi:hypothetical protein
MQIFRTQKRVFRVRDAFKEWRILPLQSQDIFSLLIFVVNNMGSYHPKHKYMGLTQGVILIFTAHRLI